LPVELSLAVTQEQTLPDYVRNMSYPHLSVSIPQRELHKTSVTSIMASSNENAVTVLERQISGWSRDSNTSTLQQASLNQTSQLVIGIDFGTTYTAVAFAHSKASLKGARVNLDTQAQLDAVLEKIIVIKNWPNASQQYAEKTPSIIAYEGGKPTRWGGQIMRTDKTKVSCFKLGLQEGARQHYQSTDNAPLLGGFLNDCNWKHPDLPSTTAADFAADYLSLVGDFVMNHVLRDRYGDQFLRNQQISYAITVPAIWSDKARDVTRRVAERAGIPEDKLTLVTEPEAAAQYCATICGEVDLQPGDHFLVCDAGGGTVVVLALYQTDTIIGSYRI
jgi:molecular chaperone DnaK (HSP70)